MMCGCWRAKNSEPGSMCSWVSVRGSPRPKPAPPPFATCSATSAKFADAVPMRCRWWRCFQRSLSPWVRTIIQPTSQQNRPATKQPNDRGDRPCFLMRGDSLSPIFVPCRGERGPRTCEKKFGELLLMLLFLCIRIRFRSLSANARIEHPTSYRFQSRSQHFGYLFFAPYILCRHFSTAGLVRLPSVLCTRDAVGGLKSLQTPDILQMSCALTVNNGRHLGPCGMCKYFYIFPKCSCPVRVFVYCHIKSKINNWQLSP